MKLSLALPLALALFGLQVPAHADVPNDEIPARSVDYSDLDLAKNTDVVRLYGRIERAARSVCHPVNGKDPQRASRFQRCIDEAVSHAVARVDSPLLTQRYAAASRAGILMGAVPKN
jgi:UrcA family protein